LTYEQTVNYLWKAIEQKWGNHNDRVKSKFNNSNNSDNVPTTLTPPPLLLGCIPDRPFLGCAALCDMERLFNATILTGSQHILRHYRIQDINVVATSLEVFLKQLRSTQGRTLFICHASRTDILLGYLMESIQRISHSNNVAGYHPTSINTTNNSTAITSTRFEPAMIVTGCNDMYSPLSTQVMEIITSLRPVEDAPPILLTDHPTDDVLAGLYKYKPKLNLHDPNRVATAIQHYEPYINFGLLLDRIQIQQPHVPTTTNNDNNAVVL
jgi:hypothetical protein